MNHQQQLLGYLKQQRMSDEQARVWLNTHCPRWQEPLPDAHGLIELDATQEADDGDH
ncbi:hypothetical protein [Zobellella denitrificans]|uniref:hypothetical protein n=1 Tax=Zobellella denitrificans TaxID=347534 RepID=UPI0012FDE982|nr:hypothetical protein [Zobellella denitrificans]